MCVRLILLLNGNREEAFSEFHLHGQLHKSSRIMFESQVCSCLHFIL